MSQGQRTACHRAFDGLSPAMSNLATTPVGPGRCILVGAGPGDPGLLTLRGKEALSSAEVVVYDYLANPFLLTHAPESAERVYVGKQAGSHTRTQDEINALLVGLVQSGKQVVRLKGGDPFLFGRGGEEAEALSKEGLEFEIVPGVTSAIGGAAYAGIPITHRGLASTLTIATGHEDPLKEGSSLDFEALAKIGGTRVFLMGVERLKTLMDELIRHGLAGETPAALVHWASTPRQRTLVSTVSRLAGDAVTAGFGAPCITIVGEVVALRDKLEWFERRSLFGKRIVVTRSRKQSGRLSEALAGLGANVDEMPLIRIEPPENLRGFGEAVATAHSYDWIIFTSPNAVDAFFEMFYRIFKDAREIGGARIAAIGPATAARVAEYRLSVDLQPDEFIADGIIRSFDEIGSIENQTFLLPVGDLARNVISQALTAKGAIVDTVVAYRTLPETSDPTGAAARGRERSPDVITFTSSSTVTNFLAMDIPLDPSTLIASIGPVTTGTLRDNGLEPHIQATRHDIPGLVDAIRDYFAGPQQ